MQIPEKHEFSLKLLVIGYGSKYIDYIIEAMRTLGELGISQQQAQLVAIEQKVSGQLPVSILSSDDHLPVSVPHIPSSPERVIIRFITPYNMNQEVMKKPFDV